MISERITNVRRADEEELDALQRELDVARGEEPRVVIVEGAAGIGKTTLVERFLSSADARVARAAGDESESEVAYGVLDVLLRHACDPPARPPASHIEAWRVAARTRSAISRPTDPRCSRSTTRSGPMRPRCRRVLFAARRLVADCVLILLVVRADETGALPDGLQKLAAGGTGAHLTLDPLELGEVRELAEQLGVAISPRGVRRLHEHSGGSPLYTRALLTEVPAPAWDDVRANLPAPRSFAELIVGRMRDWPADSVRLLEGASVLGVSSSLAVAARIAAVEQPFEALTAPTAARLTELAEGRLGPELRFTHPLTRAAIYQHLSPSRRARLHTAAAAATDDEAAGLAHRVAASIGADEALAVELEAFADRCARGRGWATATTASRRREPVERRARADRERRLLGAIEAAMYAGDNRRAQALATRGARLRGGTRASIWRSRTSRSAPAARPRPSGGSSAPGRRATRTATRRWPARIAERRAFLGILRLRGADAVEWARRARALAAPRPAGRRPRGSLALGLYYTGRTRRGPRRAGRRRRDADERAICCSPTTSWTRARPALEGGARGLPARWSSRGGLLRQARAAGVPRRQLGRGRRARRSRADARRPSPATTPPSPSPPGPRYSSRPPAASRSSATMRSARRRSRRCSRRTSPPVRLGLAEAAAARAGTARCSTRSPR